MKNESPEQSWKRGKGHHPHTFNFTETTARSLLTGRAQRDTPRNRYKAPYPERLLWTPVKRGKLSDWHFLEVPKPGCFKSGCLQCLRWSALLRSFAGLAFALFCAHLHSFALIWAFLRSTAFRTTTFGNSRISWKVLWVVDVCDFGPWMSAPKWLVSPGIAGRWPRFWPRMSGWAWDIRPEEFLLGWCFPFAVLWLSLSIDLSIVRLIDRLIDWSLFLRASSMYLTPLVDLSIDLSIDLSFDLAIDRSIDLSINLSISLSIDLSTYQSINRSIYRSIDRSIYLSIYLWPLNAPFLNGLLCSGFSRGKTGP